MAKHDLEEIFGLPQVPRKNKQGRVVRPRADKRTRGVYIVARDDEAYVKIGTSYDPVKRMKALLKENPFGGHSLNIHFIATVDGDSGIKVEAEAIRRLREMGAESERREWFLTDAATAHKAIMDACECLSVDVLKTVGAPGENECLESDYERDFRKARRNNIGNPLMHKD